MFKDKESIYKGKLYEDPITGAYPQINCNKIETQ